MSVQKLVLFVLVLVTMLIAAYSISGRRGLVGCSFGIALSLTIIAVIEKLA